MKRIIRNVLYIVIGSLIYAAGISLFLDPNDLAPGGMIGIAVILNRYTNITTGMLYFILNIPIVVLGIWRFGWRFMASTSVVILLNSWFTDVLAAFPAATTEPILACLAGGVLIGCGIGFVFRAGSTTGGTDIVVKILKTRFKHLKTGVIFLAIDMIIVAVSGLVFHNFNIAMYAFIAVFVSGRVMNVVLYGSDEARLIYIISDKHKSIAKRALEELDIGATLLSGKGAYSNNDKNVILCVVKNQAAPKLEDVVKEEDPEAFMIISSASEIYGEGYKDIMGARL